MPVMMSRSGKARGRTTALAAGFGFEIESDLRVNSLLPQGLCPGRAKSRELPWLRELEDLSVGHGVSLLD